MTITKQEFREMMDKPNFLLINGSSCLINDIKYEIKCNDVENTVELKKIEE